ncbi:LuxR family transcriptional regulator [Pararhizobium capsulatum DSM 1112]|uniref:LuxR family transcriptional regulator n=1 Tax=Pararhizobium capsulatum DSM 1112 TaxID=1121113 RepID=A0ABU0BS21_9HYPH|nr:LuxR family transcriptional regulator [Pararhizobium capsulatum]MDQ0320753.1 LuxR family transcriptional regulator [Pararhizobium capsulatum DSM 1112]
MLDAIESIRERFSAAETLDGRIDQVFDTMQQLGFEALVYDYTPVPFDLDGELMVPSLLKLRNIDSDMPEYWFDRGYFRIDPVQRLAARTSAPFFWNYDANADTMIRRFMTEETEPVARYLRARDMASGVTIPVHTPRGDYATVTGIRPWRKSATAPSDVARTIAEFGLVAHIFHESAFELFDRETRSASSLHLTERERECLRYSAQGLSAKEISRAIDRSVPTVVMHLNAAARKLGAKNRTQAVVLATHYRLLDRIL